MSHLMRLENWSLEITFEKLYAADFDYTGGNLMTSFLGLEVILLGARG
jgi:hypothetical protein